MYGILQNNKLIAFHKNMDVINSFIDDENGVFEVIQISKKKSKKIKDTFEFEDLYLVKSGNQYLPRKYALLKENETNSFKYDLQITKSTLKGLMNTDLLSGKDKKKIKKGLNVIKKREKSIKDSYIGMNTLEGIHELDKLFKERMNDNE